MKRKELSRREFLKASIGIALGATTTSLIVNSVGCSRTEKEPTLSSQVGSVSSEHVVSIAKIKYGKIGVAVEEAIDLLGGIEAVTEGKERIMLKPNLVAESPDCTTKPEVIKTLARLMKDSGKEVLIGEGSAWAYGFNMREGETYRTKNQEILDGMQQFVFDRLGYAELAKSMGIPLINLHSGEMVDVPVRDGYVFDKITLHHSLADIDLLCSVPMMKTHMLATVTLGMKNLIGLYPGTVYYAPRAWLHDHATKAGSPGFAFEIIDMVKANKLGLVVVDGSMAMEGAGPVDGRLVWMGLIVAGTNPLATDMVAANLMGFETDEIPTFTWAHRAGMKPTSMDEIEVRGERMSEVRRKLEKPNVISWNSISQSWAVKEMQ